MGFTLTVTSGVAVVDAASLDPPFGVASSQPPPFNVDVCTVQFNTPDPRFSTPKLCGGIAPPFCTAVNVSPVCDSSMMSGLVVIVIVTGIVTDPVPGVVPVIVTCPV